MADAVGVAPRFTTETGTCRTPDCENPAPVIVIDRERTPTLCETCQRVDDQHDLDRETSRLVELAGIPRRLAAWTLETYSTDDLSRNALEDARQWLSAYLAGRQLPVDEAVATDARRNLLLAGSIGAGKSALAAALTRELCANGVGARWVVLRDMLEAKRESFDGGPRVDLDTLRRAPVLVLDDIGAERLTPWAAEQLEVIVSTRYDACTPTICTSNLTPAQLAAAIAASGTGRDEDPELIRAQRIVSRLTEGAQRIQFHARDRRLARAHVRARNSLPTERRAA